MTLDETRQLGIEFERRVQTMIPEKEYLDKLDTDTIYAYLNQYQDKFVHDIYKALDLIPQQSKPQLYIDTILLSLILENVINITKQKAYYTATLPEDFGLYLESWSNVKDLFKYKYNNAASGIVKNEIVKAADSFKYLPSPNNNMRILRNPVLWLAGSKKINIIYDIYTKPEDIQIKYYKIPVHMNLFKKVPCDLPSIAFDDIVSGAVDLYVQYVAGAESRKRLLRELQELKNKNNKEDES